MLRLLAVFWVLAAIGCAGSADGPSAVDFQGQDPSQPDASDEKEKEPPPLSTPPMALLDEDAFYPRAIELASDVVLASVVAPQASGRLGGTILESTDGGVTFDVVGHIDGDLSLGGLCCASIYQLPRALGALPKGALVWSASVGGDSPDAPMSLPVFASTDRGRTWAYLSTVVVAGVPRSKGGLWEPEFSQLEDGSLVCHYSDETDAAHSQKLVARRSADGVTWNVAQDTVALPAFGARPGMPVVRKIQDGPYVMSLEVCGTDGCATHLRVSSDGWGWGDPSDPGLRPATPAGRHFRHAPTLALLSLPDVPAHLFLVGQMLHEADGAVASNNGSVILANPGGGWAPWEEVPAPVAVPEAYDNFCPNYSSAILPLENGRAVLEIASKWDGQRCRSYYARGPLLMP